MKYLYLIVNIISFVLVICNYQVETFKMLLIISSIAFVCLDKIDQLNKKIEKIHTYEIVEK